MKAWLKAGAVVGLLPFALLVMLSFQDGGTRTLVVLSGSMEPYFAAGDLVVVTEVHPLDVEVGDVLTFRKAEGRGNVLVTHRVIELVPLEDATYFRTKGDAVEEPDLALVSPKAVEGKTAFVVPHLGHLVAALRGQRAMAFTVFVILPTSIIIANEIRSLLGIVPAPKSPPRPRVVKPERLVVAMVAATVVAGVVALPYLAASGASAGGATFANPGRLDAVAVFPDGAPTPGYLPLARGADATVPGTGLQDLSLAPRILPLAWLVAMAAPHHLLPAMASLAAPALALTAALLPLWAPRAPPPQPVRFQRLPRQAVGAAPGSVVVPRRGDAPGAGFAPPLTAPAARQGPPGSPPPAPPPGRPRDRGPRW